MYQVRDCLQHQANGLLLWKYTVVGHKEGLPSKNVWLLVSYGGSGVLMKVPLLRFHFTQLLGEKFLIERWRGRWGGWEGGEMMLFSFPLQKPLWCWSWQLRILPHLLPFPHAWGKITTQTTSKHGGCLYTLSDCTTVTVYCICVLGL